MTVVLIRGGHLDILTEGRQCEDIGRRWTSTHQGGRPGTGPSLTASRRKNPALTLLSDFLRENVSVV